jgi:hypothetical protein
MVLGSIKIEFAKSSQSKCKKCKGTNDEKIDQGEIRFLIAADTQEKFNYNLYSNYHFDCFWNSEVRKFFSYKREPMEGKLLKIEDMKGYDDLPEDMQDDLLKRIYNANQQYATIDTLTEAGIPIPSTRNEAENEEETAKDKKKKNKRKKADQTDSNDGTPSKKKRSSKKKEETVDN